MKKLLVPALLIIALPFNASANNDEGGVNLCSGEDKCIKVIDGKTLTRMTRIAGVSTHTPAGGENGLIQKTGKDLERAGQWFSDRTGIRLPW